MAEASSADRGQTVAFFALGLSLPLLGGGNVLVMLQPDPAVALLATVSVLVGLLLASERRLGSPISATLAASLIAFLAVWIANYALRATGPRAGAQTLAVLSAVVLSLGWLRRGASRDELRGFLVGLLIGTLGTVAYAQHQYWTVFPRIAPILQAAGREPMDSVNANFYSPNSYAPFLAAMAMLAAPLLASTEPRAVRALAAIALPLFLVTLAMTRSRSTIVLSAAIVGAIILGGAARRRTSVALALAAIAGAIAFILVVDLADLWRVGTLGRAHIWHGALRMIADHWLFGVGLGGFGEAFHHYRTTDYYTRYPHNFWLEAFAETGVLGIVPLTVFLVVTLRSAVRALADAVPGYRRAMGLAAVLLVTHASFDIDWHAPANLVLTFLLLSGVATGSTEGTA